MILEEKLLFAYTNSRSVSLENFSVATRSTASRMGKWASRVPLRDVMLVFIVLMSPTPPPAPNRCGGPPKQLNQRATLSPQP